MVLKCILGKTIIQEITFEMQTKSSPLKNNKNTLSNMTITATHVRVKNRATININTPAPALLPTVLNAVIHPLQVYVNLCISLLTLTVYLC
jgi:hypothetical protein